MRSSRVTAALVVLSCVALQLLLLACPLSALPSSARHERVKPPSLSFSNPSPITQSVTSIPPTRTPLGVNAAVDPAIDCPLKTFAASFASYLQPQGHPVIGNWTEEVVEALRLPRICNITVDDVPPPPFLRPPTLPPLTPSACQFKAYVDHINGDDSNPGTLERPWKEAKNAVSRSRARLPPDSSACIFLRAGSYFWGDHTERFGSRYESQVGSLSLLAVDSGLTLAAYNGEEVIFSGGVNITGTLKWTVYKQTPKGPIMMAKLPASTLSLDWNNFNELYIDDFAAIRAKYPNGDPFTTGRHTDPTGYVEGADSWIPPDKSIPSAVEIHVSEPLPNSTFFPEFQVSKTGAEHGRTSLYDPSGRCLTVCDVSLYVSRKIGVEGTVRNFDPPHSYWGLANPPVSHPTHYNARPERPNDAPMMD